MNKVDSDKLKKPECQSPNKDIDDLDIFIEKCKVQNKALKKIVEMNSPLPDEAKGNIKK